MQDLRIPPGNRLEALSGARSGQQSVRITFGASERLWLGLQADYELAEARRAVGRKIDREVSPRSA